MKRLLLLLFVIGSFSAMEPDRRAIDANGYKYRDENTVQDKRKIAILSYGSLVKQNTNAQTGAQLHASPFASTNVTLPVALMRQSQGNRITAVIDRAGDPKKVWAAASGFTFLPNARNNLAAREGAPYRGQDTGYDLTNIFYMKKLAAGRMKDNNEEMIPGVPGWVIRTENNERQKLPVEVTQNLARWADTNGYSAIIWASFAPNISSRAVVIQKLLENNELLRNTQEYVRNLPDGAQTEFERAILVGAPALQNMGGPVQRPAPILPPAQAPAAQMPAQVPVDHERHHEKFTYYQRGDLPILVTAPHGGVQEIPDIPRRTGQGVPQFVTVWDDGTLELTFDVSDAINNILGARPYLVVADFTRKQIDANRPPDRAYETRAAKEYYDFYHDKVAQYVQELKKRFGDKVILVDIHGQGIASKTVYRGTQNRQTVKRLLNRAGEAAFTGPQSILGALHQKGNMIHPVNNDLRQAEHNYFSGGYTVRHYGSNNGNGIDALQLENGSYHRNAGRAKFAQDLGEAITEFYFNYLTQ